MKTKAIVYSLFMVTFWYGFVMGYALRGPTPGQLPDTRPDLSATVVDGGVMSEEMIIRHQLFGGQ